MLTRDQLHHLVNELPESEIDVAGRFLQARADPLLRALMDAPPDDEPETDEERAAVAEAKAEIARGEWSRWDDVEKRLFGAP